MAGARVLDLVAGSGARGLEALSRGAASVVFVERAPKVAAALQRNLDVLEAGDRARVVTAEAGRFLVRAAEPFDLVFLDPPFRSAMIGPVCVTLAAGGWLSAGAVVYLEFDRRGPAPALPDDWSLARENSSGAVTSWLARLPR